MFKFYIAETGDICKTERNRYMTSAIICHVFAEFEFSLNNLNSIRNNNHYKYHDRALPSPPSLSGASPLMRLFMFCHFS